MARWLLRRGIPTWATTREPERLRGLEAEGLRVLHIDTDSPETLRRLGELALDGSVVLHSVPLATNLAGELFDPTPGLLEALGGRPSRVVYLSTTGVYGAQREVNETTGVMPRTPRESLRVEAEKAVMAGPWESLILRPAAIYGPWRGVHVSLLKRRHPLVGDGGNFVSRVHVDDLAAHALAALLSGLTGAYPVADEEPCTSREMIQFCTNLLGIPMPPSVEASAVSETRRADRRVDGTAIRRLLGVTLRYPSYRTGVPACVAAESALATGADWGEFPEK